MASINSKAAARAGPVERPQDRTQATKLEIPYGHAFDSHGVSSPKKRCARGRPVGPRSAIEERTVAEGHFKPAHGRNIPDVAFHLLPPSLGRGGGLAQRDQDLRRLLPYREVRLDERAADPAFCVDYVGRGNGQHPDR